MKKVLIVSSTPYSNSNRGIDIICNAYKEKGYIVDHYTFPTRKRPSKIDNVEENELGINQLYSQKNTIGYYEKLMWFLPELVTKLFIKEELKSNTVDFNAYSTVVLESGKPLMLAALIPNNVDIIYRQSDPVKLFLSRNRYFWELENHVMKRAKTIFIVRDMFRKYISKDYLYKTITVVNGFNVSKEDPKITKNDIFPTDSKNAVYLGFTPLDFDTIDYLCFNHTDVNFNIIGSCLSNKELNRLKRYSNFKYHGVLPSSSYLPLIKYSDIGIMPFKDWKAIKYVGLNSKFLIFMKYGLPIISYKVGAIDEFENLPVKFCDNKHQFSREIEMVKDEKKLMRYNIDFDYYSINGRIKEYFKYL
jgi:hypothetical protein